MSKKQTIADVVKSTLGGDSGQAEDLIIRLERAGFLTDEPSFIDEPTSDRRITGRAVIHMESAPGRSGERGVLDTQVHAVLFLTPIYEDDVDDPKIVRYDVMMEGYTIPESEENGRHLSLFLTEVD